MRDERSPDAKDQYERESGGLEQAGRAAERATIAGLRQELAQARAELQEIQRKITRG